jgi:hypothetical protein
MLRSVCLVLALVAQTAFAQRPPREIVLPITIGHAQPIKTPPSDEHVLADSAGWVLSLRVDRFMESGSCHIATRVRPQAMVSRFTNGALFFTIDLGNHFPEFLSSVAIRLDNAPAVTRKATRDERTAHFLFLRDDELTALRAATRIRVRASYTLGDSAAGHRDHDVDLRGLRALFHRVERPACGGPG